MCVANRTFIWIFLYVVKCGYTSSVPRTDYGELKLFISPSSYNVDTTVLVNDASRRDKEVGYKIKASLDLAPFWTNGHSEFLLKFDLLSPTLHSRGTHITADFMPQKSLWDNYPHSTFYAHWKNGLVEAAYLDQTEPADIINYKKSLISLFQFQIIDGEHNETDISGSCKVMYESLSMQTIRKIKSGCRGPEKMEAEAEASVASRRLTRYSLSHALDALDELYAEEVHTMGDVAASFALKTRAWQRLTRSPAPSPAAAPAPTPAPADDLPAALAALPAALTPHSLQLLAPDDDNFDDDMDARSAWAEAASALRMEEAGEGGDAASARAALRVLPALRRARRPELLALLRGERDAAGLRALLRLLALAAAPHAHRAAAAFLQLHDPDHAPSLDLARLYLDNLALADSPHEEVILDVLKLGETEWGAGAGALLAAAAAAPRAGSHAERTVRDVLLKGLAKCKEEEEECHVSRVEALGNLRRADTAEALLAAAERGAARGAAQAALSALRALRALPAGALLHAARLRRLEALALALAARPPPFDVRVAALDLLLERSAPAPLELERVARALHGSARGHVELRRIFWQRLRALAPDHEAVRTLLRLLPLRLTGWHEQALLGAGTSSVLERAVAGAGAAGGRRARLGSLQAARGGLLRRGRVHLLLLDAANATDEAVAVELWTRGLEAIAGETGTEGANDEVEGAGEGAEGAGEEVEGGLTLAVGGALLPTLSLFRGQGELLGHVWAGRGSEPTGVVRALRPLGTRGALVPLAAGAALRVRLRAAHSLALDAHAHASLWARTARARLSLRAALAAECEARVGPLPALVVAHAALDAEPRLSVAVDLDFYDGVALCVRASVPAHERRQSVRLRAPRVRRSRSVAWPAPARTLALGAPNDLACRTLASADD